MTTLHDEILKGVARGWSFTPLDGKVPIIQGWQNNHFPCLDKHIADGCNVGLRTGSNSGIAVIDIEAESFAQPSDFPETVTVITGGGGFHLYYTCYLPIPNSVCKLAPKVDVKGDRGQVVFVGSTHPDTGRIYQWFWGMSPDDIPIAEFPYHLLPKHRPVLPRSNTVDVRAVGDAEQRCAKYLGKCSPPPHGGGHHNARLRASRICWYFGLDRPATERVMDGYNHSGPEPCNEYEMKRLIDSAYQYVMSRNEIGLMLRRA